jgi:hypothetical protein
MAKEGYEDLEYDAALIEHSRHRHPWMKIVASLRQVPLG